MAAVTVTAVAVEVCNQENEVHAVTPLLQCYHRRGGQRASALMLDCCKIASGIAPRLTGSVVHVAPKHTRREPGGLGRQHVAYMLTSCITTRLASGNQWNPMRKYMRGVVTTMRATLSLGAEGAQPNWVHGREREGAWARDGGGLGGVGGGQRMTGGGEGGDGDGGGKDRSGEGRD